MNDTLNTDERFKTLHPSYYDHWNNYRVRPDSGVQIEEFANSRPRLTATLHEAGVSLLAGTDGPQLFYGFPGSSLHDELSLMVEAGLTPAEALRTATINPAEYFGKDYRMGTVAVGNTADLVLLDNNPIADIDNIGSVNSVVLKGRLLDRVELDKMIKDVKTKVQEYKSREKGNN